MSSKLPELYNTYLNQFPRYPHNNRKKKSDSKASKENDKLVKILNTKMFKGYTKIKESHTKHSEYKMALIIMLSILHYLNGKNMFLYLLKIIIISLTKRNFFPN